MDYNPIHLAVLAAWAYSGVYALNFVDRRETVSVRWRAWLNLAALFTGPVMPVLFTIFDKACSLRRKIAGMAEQAARRKIDITLIDSRGKPLSDVDDGDGTAGAVFRLKTLMFEALGRRASDVFLDPKADGASVVRFRVDGALQAGGELDASLGAGVVRAIKGAAGMFIADKRRPQEGAFSCVSSLGSASFRVASAGAFGGEKIAIHVLAAGGGPETLEEAGASGGVLKAMRDAVRTPSGMIVVCGPPGSGRTTTVRAMLREMDCSTKNVVSIEDPIGGVIENVSQLEVNAPAGVTFARLLNNVLSQSPDVICLSDLRDTQTAVTAVRAAQSGRLVIASMDGDDCWSVFERLTGLGVPLRGAAAAVRLIVSQRLVRTLCGCRRPAELSAGQREVFADLNLGAGNVCAPVGCRECGGSGYRGMTAVFDILVVDDALRAALESDGASLPAVRERLEAERGGRGLVRGGYGLVAAGITSLEEVERAMQSEEA